MEGLDLEPVESAFVSQDAARLIAQLDEWFKMRLDVLNQYKKSGGHRLRRRNNQRREGHTRGTAWP